MRGNQERYARQETLPQIGRAGQERLATCMVTIIGCGGLGTVSAGLLTRAGVGRLRLVDNDRVDLSNLQRQVLYYESDLGRPKAVAAAERLRAIDGDITIEPVVARLRRSNAVKLLRGSDLVLDGTDNDATRYLLNEVCLRLGIPWVFAAVDECYGLTMAIVPDRPPCFRCVFGDPLRPHRGVGTTKGILAPIAHIVASLQASQALRLLVKDDNCTQGLVYVDAWEGRLERVEVKAPPEGCPSCR